MSSILNKTISEVANKHNISFDLAEKIIRSQFEFVRTTIESGEFKSVRLHHFGSFRVKPGRLYILNKLSKLKKDKQINLNEGKL